MPPLEDTNLPRNEVPAAGRPTWTAPTLPAATGDNKGCLRKGLIALAVGGGIVVIVFVVLLAVAVHGVDLQHGPIKGATTEKWCASVAENPLGVRYIAGWSVAGGSMELGGPTVVGDPSEVVAELHQLRKSALTHEDRNSLDVMAGKAKGQRALINASDQAMRLTSESLLNQIQLCA